MPVAAGPRAATQPRASVGSQHRHLDRFHLNALRSRLDNLMPSRDPTNPLGNALFCADLGKEAAGAPPRSRDGLDSGGRAGVHVASGFTAAPKGPCVRLFSHAAPAVSLPGARCSHPSCVAMTGRLLAESERSPRTKHGDRFTQPGPAPRSIDRRAQRLQTCPCSWSHPAFRPDSDMPHPRSELEWSSAAPRAGLRRGPLS